MAEPTPTPIIRARNPHPVECQKCGEGELHLSFVRSGANPSPSYAYFCTTCSYSFPEPVH